MLDRIRYRILLVVALATTLGLIATITLYSRHHEQTLLAQNESTMRKLADTVAAGLQSVMLAGSADIAQAFADRLKQVPDVTEFDVLRADGTQAFRDNKTITDVNARRGEEAFLARGREEVIPVMPSDDPDLRQAVNTLKPVMVVRSDAAGNRQLVFLAPLANQNVCYRCHGKAQAVRGVMRMVTSLAAVERDILRSRQESLALFALALVATVLLTGYMLGRIVVRPIEKVTRAMARVSDGDLDYKVSERGDDELGQMGARFNQMTRDLQGTYHTLRREQDKLTTVIETATEGIIVTDVAGAVVLVNPAAALLLGKPAQALMLADFLDIVDDRPFMAQCLRSGAPQDIHFKQRDLQLHATVIGADRQLPAGSVALIRDVTEERRLEEALRRSSTTDALTGLYNRRFLDATLATEFTRAERGQSALSVLMIDIDHFKQFNDTHGHDQGDRVLQMVSRCMRDSVRPFDFACRYGGEEFAAILPGMDGAAARQAAEKLRLTVAQTEVDGLRVHISIGLASFPLVAVLFPDALIKAADAALYRAKESGRNRVVEAQAP